MLIGCCYWMLLHRCVDVLPRWGVDDIVAGWYVEVLSTDMKRRVAVSLLVVDNQLCWHNRAVLPMLLLMHSELCWLECCNKWKLTAWSVAVVQAHHLPKQTGSWPFNLHTLFMINQGTQSLENMKKLWITGRKMRSDKLYWISKSVWNHRVSTVQKDCW
jgi:hypothetical protein